MTKLSKDKIAELLTLHAVGEKDKFKASEINSKMEKELNDGLEAHMKKYKDHDIWAADDYVGKPDDALIELLEKVAQLGNFSILEAFSIEAIEKQIEDTFGFKRGNGGPDGGFIHKDDLEIVARELMIKSSGKDPKDSAATAAGKEIRKQLEKVGWEVLDEAKVQPNKIPHRMPIFEDYMSGGAMKVNEGPFDKLHSLSEIIYDIWGGESSVDNISFLSNFDGKPEDLEKWLNDNKAGFAEAEKKDEDFWYNVIHNKGDYRKNLFSDEIGKKFIKALVESDKDA